MSKKRIAKKPDNKEKAITKINPKASRISSYAKQLEKKIIDRSGIRSHINKLHRNERTNDKLPRREWNPRGIPNSETDDGRDHRNL